MRIAHVLSSLHTGGAERVALLLCERLVRRGHDVTVVSLEEPPEGILQTEFAAANARVIKVSKVPGGFDRTLPPRVYATLREGAFDVVHTHNPIPLIYAAVVARLSGARVVHTKHGPHPDAWHRLWLRRTGAAATHAFVAVSEQTAAFSRKIYEVFPWKLHVVMNGTDLDRFRASAELRKKARADLGIGEHAWVFGTVGRMEKVKNHPLLLRAAAPLLGEDVRLVIVGHGSEADSTRALADSLGVSRYVHFTGETRDVARYVTSFDAFVLSSDSEGLPLSLTEAMGASLPMVSTAVGGVPRVIDEGETGWLAPAGDESALRRAMARLSDDPALARKMGTRGREVAEVRYSVERMVDDYERLYRG